MYVQGSTRYTAVNYNNTTTLFNTWCMHAQAQTCMLSCAHSTQEMGLVRIIDAPDGCMLRWCVRYLRGFTRHGLPTAVCTYMSFVVRQINVKEDIREVLT